MSKLLRQKRLIWILLAVFLLTDAALFLSVLVAPPSTLNATLRPTAEYLEQNPAPTPEFISEFWNMENRVCSNINQRPFARAGVRAREVYEYIVKHEQFKVDDSSVSPTGNIWEITTLSFENGKEYGGAITFCFDTTNLTAGLHLASITIPDFDGVEHSYKWAFRYDPNEPTSDPNILPTPMILPSETPAT